MVFTVQPGVVVWEYLESVAHGIHAGFDLRGLGTRDFQQYKESLENTGKVCAEFAEIRLAGGWGCISVVGRRGKIGADVLRRLGVRTRGVLVRWVLMAW